jgi:hypothetical protein
VDEHISGLPDLSGARLAKGDALACASAGWPLSRTVIHLDRKDGEVTSTGAGRVMAVML